MLEQVPQPCHLLAIRSLSILQHPFVRERFNRCSHLFGPLPARKQRDMHVWHVHQRVCSCGSEHTAFSRRTHSTGREGCSHTNKIDFHALRLLERRQRPRSNRGHQREDPAQLFDQKRPKPHSRRRLHDSLHRICYL